MNVRLSENEREALALLRRHPRTLRDFAERFGSLGLRQSVTATNQSLLDKGLIRKIGILDFVVLTDEGYRLQREQAT